MPISARLWNQPALLAQLASRNLSRTAHARAAEAQEEVDEEVEEVQEWKVADEDRDDLSTRSRLKSRTASEVVYDEVSGHFGKRSLA